jgi:hypothetical protein
MPQFAEAWRLPCLQVKSLEEAPAGDSQRETYQLTSSRHALKNKSSRASDKTTATRVAFPIRQPEWQTRPPQLRTSASRCESSPGA